MTHVLANKVKIEYTRDGNQDDDVIILIRGLGSQLIDWPDNFKEGLVNLGLQVVTFDNRDTGLSQHFDNLGVPKLGDIAKGQVPPPYELDEMASDVIGLMDELNIQQAHILGISMGGMIAQLLAVDHGSRLLSMMSVMSSSSRKGLPAATDEAQASLMDVPDPAKGAEGVYESVANGLVVCGSPAYPESLETRMNIAKRRHQRSYNPAGVSRQMAAVIHDGDRSARLAMIKTPTTVVHGEDDPLIPIACGEDTAACIPGSQFVAVPGMGHNLPWDLMPKLVEIVDDHIKGLT